MDKYESMHISAHFEVIGESCETYICSDKERERIERGREREREREKENCFFLLDGVRCPRAKKIAIWPLALFRVSYDIIGPERHRISRANETDNISRLWFQAFIGLRQVINRFYGNSTSAAARLDE